VPGTGSTELSQWPTGVRGLSMVSAVTLCRGCSVQCFARSPFSSSAFQVDVYNRPGGKGAEAGGGAKGPWEGLCRRGTG